MELDIIEYCARECERQGSGEVSVYYMCNAWQWAQEKWEYCPTCAYAYKDENAEFPHNRIQQPINLEFIEYLGQLVEPTKNKNGFRRIPIGVDDPNLGWIEKASWERVPDLLTSLLEAYYSGGLIVVDQVVGDWEHRSRGHKLSKTAEDQFYYEYENIHPFRDGNGRTGKIIYNYLCGTLNNPIMPPNFWGCSNP
jgi:hypothetical protein